MQVRFDINERYFAVLDVTAEGNVDRPYLIRRSKKAARQALEACLCLAVLFLGMPTAGAAAGSVPRINDLEGHTGEGALVFELGAEVVEGPTVVPVALRLPDAHPVTDAGQVLDTHAFPFGCGLVYDAPADLVVDRLLEASLSAPEPSQDALRAPCAFGLERTPCCLIPRTGGVYLLAAERRAVVQRRQLDYAQIDADPFVFLVQIGRGRLHVNVDADVVPAGLSPEHDGA